MAAEEGAICVDCEEGEGGGQRGFTGKSSSELGGQAIHAVEEGAICGGTEGQMRNV
jgi:hypothetical protein